MNETEEKESIKKEEESKEDKYKRNREMTKGRESQEQERVKMTG